MKKIFILLLGFYITCYQLSAQKDTIVLWPDGAPGALGKDAADIPLIICYPAKNNPTPVSYTHLDVYKRQQPGCLFYISRPYSHHSLL